MTHSALGAPSPLYAENEAITYDRIKKVVYKVPPKVPQAAKELIGLLLQREPVRVFAPPSREDGWGIVVVSGRDLT